MPPRDESDLLYLPSAPMMSMFVIAAAYYPMWWPRRSARDPAPT
jgi:hypothetical protein